MSSCSRGQGEHRMHLHPPGHFGQRGDHGAVTATRVAPDRRPPEDRGPQRHNAIGDELLFFQKLVRVRVGPVGQDETPTGQVDRRARVALAPARPVRIQAVQPAVAVQPPRPRRPQEGVRLCPVARRVVPGPGGRCEQLHRQFGSHTLHQMLLSGRVQPSTSTTSMSTPACRARWTSRSPRTQPP